MKSDTPVRIFLDSNVWFSAFYGSANCEKLIRTDKSRRTLIISEQVLEESTRNIKEKIPHQLLNFKTALLTNPPELVSDPQTIPADSNHTVAREDRPIFAAAISAHADYFVTGNIKDFKRNRQKKIGKITILTPKEAVEMLRLE